MTQDNLHTAGDLLELQRTGRTLEGMEAVREALDLEAFPLDRQGVYYAIGDILVRDARGDEFFVRDVLDRVRGERFGSTLQITDALQRALGHHLD